MICFCIFAFSFQSKIQEEEERQIGDTTECLLFNALFFPCCLSKLIKQWNFHLVHVIFGHERREIGKLGSPLL